MRKKLLILLCHLCISVIVLSQSKDPSIISAGGGTGKTSTISLEWTMGEYAVETLTAVGKMYTQGFHQPLHISSSSVARTSTEDIDYNISIAPNPIVNTVNFNITSTKPMKVFVTIGDASGVPHIQRNITSNTGNVAISLNHMAAGTYLLTVRSGVTARVIKTYKIIKPQ